MKNKNLNKNKSKVTKAIEHIVHSQGVTTPEAQEIYAKMPRKKQRKLRDSL